MTEATSTDPVRLVGIAQAELRGRLDAFQPGDFVETYRNVETLRGGARLQFVTLRQTVGGVPIDDSYLRIGVRYDEKGAKLVSSSYRLFEDVPVDAQPAIAGDGAVGVARQGLRLRASERPSSEDLVVHELGGRLQLAWRFVLPGSYFQTFVVASGPEQGRVYSIDARRYATHGTVTGPVVRGGAPRGLGTPQTQPLAGIEVSGGGSTVHTDVDGQYTITVPDETQLTATLSGRAAVVVDVDGHPVDATRSAADGQVVDLPMIAADEGGLAQVTAYHVVDQLRSFLEANGMGPAQLGAPITIFANDFGVSCLAYYSSFPVPFLDLFKSGGGCNNSAIDTLIAHDYGHFVDDMNGGSFFDDGLGEGQGDLLACLWSKQPEVGFDLFPGKAVRSCKNRYRYRPDLFDTTHNLGQAWAGFGWDARHLLIGALGPTGDDVARALLLPTFQSNVADIPPAVLDVFLRDDDDGDLSNHTPHWDQLFEAAVNHSLSFVVEADDVPPAAVSDLSITDVRPAQITVRWTATGDDGSEGTAAFYRLRWSTAPIDANNVDAAIQVEIPSPQAPGTTELANIVVPPATQIFVALIVFDEHYNSTFSNMLSVTTPAGTTMFSDDVEGDVSSWTATGQWHVSTRHASAGTHSFGYCDENGGYASPSTGDLTSPVIDLTSAREPVLIYDHMPNIWSFVLETFLAATGQVIISDVNNPAHTVTIDEDMQIFFFEGTSVPRMIPLVDFAGKKITVRFRFNALDPVGPRFEGWFIDRVRVVDAEG